MIGQLPASLKVNDIDYKIRTDYRVCLTILEAFNDTELTEQEQGIIMLKCLYIDADSIPLDDVEEAVKQAIWFLNCGDTISNPSHHSKPLYSWEQDEQMIFSSINKVAGTEVRNVEYMHFWTFVGLFNEIGEGMFSSVINIRNKKNKGKKLEKHEQEFYKDHRDIINISRKYTEAEKEELKILDEILKGDD